MKLLLLFIFPFITIFCNPGTITDYEYNKRFILKCDEPECFYDLEFDETGDYQYITEDKKDTVTFLVTENLGTMLLKRTENKPFLFEIIP